MTARAMFAIFLVFVLLLVLLLVFSVFPQVAPIRSDLTFQSVLGALGGIFVIVLLVERATEIAITIWRQSAADSLKEEIGFLAMDDSKAAELLMKSKQLATYRAETKSIALLVGFSLSEDLGDVAG